MKKIFVNFIIFIFLMSLINVLCKHFYNIPLVTYTKKKDIFVSDMSGASDIGRSVSGSEYKKNGSILLVGCSFVYGCDMKKYPAPFTIPLEETLGYQLADYSKMQVYNKSYPAQGIQYVLYYLENNDVYFNDINDEPKYVIYTFIDDHIRRMISRYFLHKNIQFTYLVLPFNKFIPIHPKLHLFDNFLSDSYLANEFYNKIIQIIPDNIKFSLLKVYILRMNKNVKRIWPNSKLAIMIYPNVDLHGLKAFKTNRWKELEKEDIKIIEFNEEMAAQLKTNKKYLAEDGVHPSVMAYKYIVPEIAKKLNL